MTREEKLKAIVEHETSWVLDGASPKDIDDLMLNGWEGFNSFNNERLDKVFKDMFEEN
jgi:hypothetical protein